MNRSFIILLALVMFLGAGFGGSFVGGVIYGQNQAENAAGELAPRLGAGGQFQEANAGTNAGPNAGQRGQGRQGTGANAGPGQRGGFGGGQDGPAAQQGDGDAAGDPGGQGQDVAAAQPQDSPAVSNDTGVPAGETSQPSPAGPANRGSAVGVVKSLEGDVLTVTSPRGDLAVALSESTRVFQVSETGRESLAAEANVRVIGSRNPEGDIAAQSVVIVPAGVENLFGAAGGPGGRRRGAAP